MKVAAVSLLILPAAVAIEDGSALANVVSVGVRPYYLVDRMKSSSLKDTLGKYSTSTHFIVARDTIILTQRPFPQKNVLQKSQ